MIVSISPAEDLNRLIVVLDGLFEFLQAFFRVPEVSEALSDFYAFPFASGMLLDDESPT